MTQDKVDRRTAARVLAMQSLYQLDVQGEELLEQLPMGFLRESGQDDFVRKMAFEMIKGTWKNLSLCDELISGAIIRWQMSRLSPVDKSILRMSVYQLKFCSDIPPKVVINEAIELGKKFSSEKSSGFINGVLDAVLKKL
jgi:transcription antitermination factor NusB